jgi:hypothetical protein
VEEDQEEGLLTAARADLKKSEAGPRRPRLLLGVGETVRAAATCGIMAAPEPVAFSSEADTGSREESASTQESGDVSQFKEKAKRLQGTTP